MIKRKKTGGKRTTAFVLAAVLLAGMFAGIGRAESQSLCLAALEKCVVEGAVLGFLSRLWGTILGGVSCIFGYDFCRRYIQPV